MIAVLFEAWANENAQADYLSLAAALRPELGKVDGFVSIERFQSLTEPGKILSLSMWRDETAITCWRNFAPHRAAQQAGRARIFRDYRLRIAAVMRDYGLNDRRDAPTNY